MLISTHVKKKTLHFYNDDNNTSVLEKGYPGLFFIPNSKKSTKDAIEYLGDW